MGRSRYPHFGGPAQSDDLLRLLENCPAPSRLSPRQARSARQLLESVARMPNAASIGQEDSCGPLGPPRLEPGPPLVYSFKKVPAGVSVDARSRRASVGHAQLKLNQFLRLFDRARADTSPAGMQRLAALFPGDTARAAALRARLPEQLAVTCVFADETDLATQAFQVAKGLNPDGKIGPTTWSLLSAVSDAQPAPSPGTRRPLAPGAAQASFIPPAGRAGNSWADPTRTTGLIGQIFFETGKSDLDDADMAVLQSIPPPYVPVLNAPQTPPMLFKYLGFADHRRFKGPGGNLALSEARARRVADFVRDVFVNGATDPDHEIKVRFPKYQPFVRGFGVEPGSVLSGTQDPVKLKIFRRVDIIAPPAVIPPPPPPGPKPAPIPRSDQFSFVVSGGGGVSAIADAEVLFFDVRDLVNRRRAEFIYRGAGAGLSLALNISLSPSPPQTVKTSKPIRLEDVVGFMLHGAVGVQGFGGNLFSVDEFTLFGPSHNAGADPILLSYKSALTSSDAFNVGISETVGGLELNSRVTRF